MKIVYEDEARDQLLQGAKELYKAVKTTMGPKGRNVLLNTQQGFTLTHDGVTVARGIKLDEDTDMPGKQSGAELIKRAAGKMNDSVGDGTTTVTVLTYHLLNEANKLIVAGHNPMVLKKQLDAAVEKAVSLLDSMTEAVADKAKLAEVATISAGDEDMGKLIADVVYEVGKEGAVTVEEGVNESLESEVVEGFELDSGFVSPLMATNPDKGEAVYEDPVILLTDKKLNSMPELIPLFDKIIQSGKKNVLLVADSVEGEVVPNLILNKVKGVVNIVAVSLPAFFKDRLLDIAAWTGATPIVADNELSFKSAGIECLGSARKIIVTSNKTVIVQGNGDPSERLALIDKQLKTDKYNKASLELRKAQLSGKVAVIKVGGVTETEIEEKKYRVDDAVAAAKAALSGGIVPGGGVTLVNLASKLKASDDGSVILKRALEKPFRILMHNAGVSPDEWLPQVRSEQGKGVNVAEPIKLIDLKAAGIIDPAKVTREAIQNAVSIAGTAMTMGALVVEEPEEKSDDPLKGLMQA